MKFTLPTEKGIILKRYKRFLSDIKLSDNRFITAHTANTGSMQTCWAPEWEVLLSFHNNPKRKLQYSLEMTHNGHSWIGVNTSRTNALAREAIENGVITELFPAKSLRAEVKVAESRIDFLLVDQEERSTYVEVKNVTLKVNDGICTFPDAVSTRGQKHLKTLIDLVEQGHRAVMLYIVQREDCHTFSPAYDHDPEYAQLLEQAYRKGVEILVYRCHLSEQEIRVDSPLPYTFMSEQGEFWPEFPANATQHQ